MSNTHSSKNSLYNNLNAKENRNKKLITPNGSEIPKSAPGENSLKIGNVLNSLARSMNGIGTLQEFQNLLNVYDRHAQFIISSVQRSEISNGVKLTDEEFVEKCVAKFDFIYSTLLPEDDKGYATQINEVGKKYVTSLFKINMSLDYESKEDLILAFKEYNEFFSEFYKIFITVRHDIEVNANSKKTENTEAEQNIDKDTTVSQSADLE